MLPIIAGLVLAATSLNGGGSLAAADGSKGQIILRTGGVERIEGRFGQSVFECRVPVEILYEGTPPLHSLDVIAKAYREGRELTSTGIATGKRPILPDRTPTGLAYRPVPLQFDLTHEVCRQADSLKVVFARCEFGDRIAEDCLDRIRFASAMEDEPRRLVLSDR